MVDRERCRLAGMDDFVAKPIEPDELWRSLRDRIVPREGLGQSAAVASTNAQVSEKISEFDAPPDIPGLDWALGLQRSMGKLPLYSSLLGKFADGQGDACQKIITALRDGDPPTAQRVAHTLKGVAGNVGATSVQEKAGRIEQGIAGGQSLSALETELDAFAQELSELVHRIRATRHASNPEKSSQGEPPPHAAEEAQAASRQLKALLGDDDPAAVEFFEQHRPALTRAHPHDVNALAEAIANFDFGAALELMTVPGTPGTAPGTPQS